MFIAALFTKAKLWNNQDTPLLMSGLRECVSIYLVEFYSAVRNNKIMWFEGKWMQFKDIILSEVSQAQKDKGLMFSLIRGR
jgi:hypothetical protein